MQTYYNIEYWVQMINENTIAYICVCELFWIVYNRKLIELVVCEYLHLSLLLFISPFVLFIVNILS